VVMLVAGLGLSEATGVTGLRGAVIRLWSPDGTLIVEVDDPGVSVSIGDEEMVITGAGAKEIRLKPGQYKGRGRKNGKVVSQELVTVTRNGGQVLKVSGEGGASTETAARPAATRADAAWIASVAVLPAEKQGEAVTKMLRALNPGFDDNPTY